MSSLSQVLTFLFLLKNCFAAYDIPANFVFGDSLVDVGNNNYIVSLSKANYVPNGIDFGVPTGQELGFKGFSPPYLAPTTRGNSILQGVNYASGGGGILNQTGKIFGGRINMDAQLDNFANTRQDIISTIGEPATLQLLRRKIIVANVGPVGCIPYQRDTNPSAGESCVSLPNQMARLFNTELKGLIAELTTSLQESKFVYSDVYRIVADILENYRSYGFEIANSSCCYVAGTHGGLIPCGPSSKVCSDRSKYVFWDPYHPSEATNIIIAKRLLDGDSDDISPMNVRQLAQV
ncbi:GDSL esterase/lipase [Citrus sinensis]|nr:GDSL esterase/lipase [Citrus sinensis]